jgi:hypothetical protein
MLVIPRRSTRTVIPARAVSIQRKGLIREQAGRSWHARFHQCLQSIHDSFQDTIYLSFPGLTRPWVWYSIYMLYYQ